MSQIRVILNITIESRDLDEVSNTLAALPEVVDVYEVTGESDIVAIVKANDVIDFRNMLKNKILKIEGIKTTVSSVIMYAHKKDGKMVDN
ncbi:MAG: Lrp/AsnC ligand binding domain-containing protein [Candidatus Thorarchaeota archaeon]|nr:Lrp/AsnC ligand binding domain-containing protein [Candidatus Thorarchaeota archaeon]